MAKRLFALALSVALACGLVPAAAFALPEQAAGAPNEAAAFADGSLVEGGSTDADESDWTVADVQPGAFSVPSIAALSRYNYPDAAAGVRAASEDEGDLPASFDLRETGDSTPVKYQNPWGSCWAFGTMASLESNVLVQGGLADGATPDFSERQLAWFGRTAVGAETDADQAGEGAFAKRTAGATSTDTQLTFNAGGDYGISTAVLSAWFGAADEADIPYADVNGVWDEYDTSGDWSLFESDRTVASVHVQDVISLPSPAVFSDPENPFTDNYTYDPDATAAIKRALVDNGAVSVSYHADQSRPITDPDDPGYGESEYFNYLASAQYVNAYITEDDQATPDVDERTTANHAVTIVGWDDTFSRDNFTKQPPDDGAWIVKNSWSADWGLDGCFYLSYYDMSICEPTSFLVDLPDADGSFSYDSNYQYDYLSAASVGKIEPGAFGKAVAAANVFEAEGDEVLKAVSATTANPGSTVQVEVYLLDGDATGPTDGTLATIQTTEVEYGGYHTIALDKPVALSAGQRFSVVERIEGYEGAYLPLEVAAYDANDPDEAQGGYVKAQRAVANAGESFYSVDGGATWDDVTELSAAEVQDRISPSRFGDYPQVYAEEGVGNVMIKAFTTDAAEPKPEPEPGPDPEEPDDPALRSSFDPREEGLVTPVRDQGTTDLCGPFASMASLETSLVYDSAASDELVEAGLSPFHAVYFATMGDEEREAAGLNAFMPDNPYDGGVTPFSIAASLAAGKGAVVAQEGVTDWANPQMDESLRSASDARLTDAAYLSAGAGGYWEALEGDDLRAAVKRTVVEEAPVVAEFCANQALGNFCAETSSYHTAAGVPGAVADHYVAIVGWDDAYARDNFNEGMRPERDGAWLVKNSWGVGQGDGGYFWVSYEDATLIAQAALMGEVAREGERLYQYDAAGWSESLSVGGGVAGWAANVFGSARDETLDRVQFCTTGVGTAYTVEVYRGATDADPRGGELVSSRSGVRELPGYVTVELDEPVALLAGETFSVVVRLENERYAYPIAVEAFTPDPESAAAGLEPSFMGRDEDGNREASWVSADGVNWEDPAGYGRDLAQGEASGGAAAGSGASGARSAASEGGSSRSYVTNVCVKALTMPRDASGDTDGDDGATPADNAAPAADPKALARTGDPAAAAGATALCVLVAATCAMIAAVGARRRADEAGR
ncbi:lectin like domain-containing protein [Rubneribacter sp.]|nr:hypothetical protein [Candidatus Rubneribacter avistercoris]